MRKFAYAFVLSAIFGLGASHIAFAGETAADAQQAIDKAGEEVAAAQAAKSEWQLIDKATGSSSAPLDKLLGVAKKKQEAGEYDEATRIANRVADAAMLGVAQAESQMGKVEPFYNLPE
ncbi:hypothetical protein N9H39_07930 [Gammaproteobacteria bacterium]|nr:hypothetical protein [Gammaproteobacteria bacterium]